MDLNLNTLSLKELRDLQSQVAKAIASFEDRKKREALAEVEEKARTLGFSLAELMGAQAVLRKRSPATPKYANPSDASDTWSGRGRKPRWFESAMRSGTKPEELAI